MVDNDTWSSTFHSDQVLSVPHVIESIVEELFYNDLRDPGSPRQLSGHRSVCRAFRDEIDRQLSRDILTDWFMEFGEIPLDHPAMLVNSCLTAFFLL